MNIIGRQHDGWTKSIPRDVEVFTDLAINQYHKIIELGGTGVENENANILEKPSVFYLAQNYPNPFNPETKISYSALTNSQVVLEVYNANGQKVATLVNEYKEAGSYSVKWSGRDKFNHLLPSGLFIYQLILDNVILTKKMLFIQ